jgi:hypothetical protein
MKTAENHTFSLVLQFFYKAAHHLSLMLCTHLGSGYKIYTVQVHFCQISKSAAELCAEIHF